MSFRREPKTNPIAWIVAADRAHARIFRAHWPDLNGFQSVEERWHAEGRKQGRERDEAPHGRRRGPDGTGRTFEAEDGHLVITRDFAMEIVERLEQGRAQNEFGHLVVAAPPPLLGELRNQYGSELIKLVEAEIDKELAHLDQPTILLQARGAVGALTHV